MESKTRDFLEFRKMITPSIIKVIFWIGVVVCVLVGIIGILRGAVAKYGGGAQVLGGILFLFVGPLLVRIYCELLILFFRMNETLTDIKNNMESRRGTANETVDNSKEGEKPNETENSTSETKITEEELTTLKSLAGEDAVQYAYSTETEWFCVCGTRNSLNTQNCSGCHRNRDFVLENYTENHA